MVEVKKNMTIGLHSANRLMIPNVYLYTMAKVNEPGDNAEQLIVITGASRGIGLALAQEFAAAGYRVLISGKREGILQEAVVSLNRHMGRESVQGYACDLSQKAAAEAFAAWCLERGVPDILINNAGTYRPGQSMDEPEGTLEFLLQTNLFSAYHLTRALLPSMIARARGHIVNMGSVASLQAYPGGGGYSISKFALHGFTCNLRAELMDKGIKVTGMYPGAVMTDSWQGFDNSGGRIMLASDIAHMIMASASLSPQAVVESMILRPQLGDL
jgi:short-subunit dehydrogenase